MHRTQTLAVSALAFAAVLCGCASTGTMTAKKGPPGPAAAAAEKPDKPGKPWAEVTKGAEKVPGFFTLYRKRENLYLEITPDQLGKDFLGVITQARGIGSHGLLGGLPLGDGLMAFERTGDRVFLMLKNMRFEAPEGSPMKNALDLSMGASVLASFKIESIQDSTQALLVDAASLFVSDVTDLSSAIPARNEQPGRFDKERSAITSVRNFPDNVEVEALLTYNPADREQFLPGLQDDRYIPLTVHYSFVRLPDPPMKPRLADDRVGYFLTVKKNFGRDTQENFFVRYAERWRLEKKDPSAALSEPVKPIVFYIDHTVPVEYRPWVKKGIENWQKAFEKAGFKNAIVARDAPDDSLWDAEDTRYSTIRWIASAVQPFNAIGPSRTDPRTGEIFDADVLIDAGAVQGYRNWWRRFAGPNPGPSGPSSGLVRPGRNDWDRVCEDAAGATEQASLLVIDQLVNGSLEPGSVVPDEFLEPLVVRLVMHEVGHTLGLRHNFRSSSATPVAKLHDKAWTQEHGLTGSVMDYITPNLSSDRAHQGEYFISSVGPYDQWAIRWGYTPSNAADLDADAAFAAAIADESMKPENAYGTDEDTYPAQALDPRSNVYDLGDDPLAWAKDRVKYLDQLWDHPEFETRILGQDGSFPVLRRAMDTLLGQYQLALGFAVKYVGGQYFERAHRGQPGAVAPLRPVESAKQREAMDFIADQAFTAESFHLSAARLNRLAPDRWTHWGNGNTGRFDYALNARVLGLQTGLLERLLEPSMLGRIREAESRTRDPFRLTEHFDRLTRNLWGEVGGASTPEFRALGGTGTRRSLQRTYVDRLSNLILRPASGTPDDARAVARLQLQRIDGRCAAALASANLNDDVRAHLVETRARIARTVDAGRTAAN
jgi:hypothetical protein